MQAYGLLRVLGTARIKTAVAAEHGADSVTIGPNQKTQKLSHALSPANALRRRATRLRSTRMFCGGRTRISIAPRPVCSRRNASRMQRFTRLRTFARRETFSDMRMPSLAEPAVAGATMNVNPDKDFRTPLRSIRSYSAWVAMRRSGPKPRIARVGVAPATRAAMPVRPPGAGAPSRGARRSPCDLRACSCAQEIRGDANAGSWKADRYASWGSRLAKTGYYSVLAKPLSNFRDFLVLPVDNSNRTR